MPDMSNLINLMGIIASLLCAIYKLVFTFMKLLLFLSWFICIGPGGNVCPGDLLSSHPRYFLQALHLRVRQQASDSNK